MSSEPPTSAPKWDKEITHKPEFKTSTMVVPQARNAPPAPRSPVRSSPSIDVLLTPKEAAHYLRVSLSWLAKARMRGDGPAYVKVGRSVRYTEQALILWMKSRQRLSTSEH
jgi:predicted DNA-binding transcriptional regulator AlpA